MTFERELNDDRELANQITTDVVGSLSSSRDVDWYKFVNAFPSPVEITFSWGAAKSGVWKFDLLNENFQVLNTRNMGPAFNPDKQQLSFTNYAYSVGDYYIRVSSDFAPLHSGEKYSINIDKPSFELTVDRNIATEGETFRFTLIETPWRPPSYPTYYTISGIEDSDITIPLKGELVVSGERTSIEVPTIIDQLSEGTETLTLEIGRYTGGLAGANYVSDYVSLASLSVKLSDKEQTLTSTDSSNLTDSQANPPPDQSLNIHVLDVIVDLFGQVLYLKGLTETVSSTAHTIEYEGTSFNYSDVDGLLTTVVRDGEFTEEFAKEIADAYPSVAGISYSTAVALVGASAIEDVLIAVAGADGDFIG